METKTPSKLEQVLPARNIIVTAGNGYETVFDGNAHVRAQVKNVFRELVVEAIDETDGIDLIGRSAAIVELLNEKIGKL